MSYTDIIADGTILGDVPGIRPGSLFRKRAATSNGAKSCFKREKSAQMQIVLL